MQLISFTPNQPVVLFDQHYVIQNVVDNDLTLRCESSGATRTYALETLQGLYRGGNLRGGKPPARKATAKATTQAPRVARRTLADVSASAREEAEARLEFMRAIDRSGLTLRNTPELREVVDEVAHRLGRTRSPSWSSLERWARRMYRSGGDPSALIPDFGKRGGAGKCRAPKEIAEMMEAVIDNFYMTIEARSIRDAYEELARRLQGRFNWTEEERHALLPSYTAFHRRVRSRGAYELYAARHGRRAAQQHFRSVGRTSEMHAFNDCWEIDHTVLDLMIVDQKTKFALKRPRLTVAIEYTTSALMGFDVDFSGTSSQAVLNCLRHAITPKGYVKERHPEVEGQWQCCGVPRVLKMDNGMEFHSQSVRDACFDLGIEMQYAPVRQPWFKGSVERFFRTSSQGLLAQLPGYAGPDRKRRKDTEDANLPVLDLETFNKLLHIWAIDIYMNSGEEVTE